MRIVRRKETLVGFLVLIALFALFGRGIGLFVFFGSIICTAGIALVIWIPLSFLIGLMIFGLIDLFGGKKEAVAEIEAPKSKQQKALINYIYQARKDGFSDEKIASFLKDQGWTDDEIGEAFNSSRRNNF